MRYAGVSFDRCWLLTWTTYGTWLPGDERGFVSPVTAAEGAYVLHNKPRTAIDKDMPRLREYAKSLMAGLPIYLTTDQAKCVSKQFCETAAYRSWLLIASAVMAKHTHLVVGVTGDPEPNKLLHDFKSYGTRALNKRWPRPKSETWWTRDGSKRKLPDEEAIAAAVLYLRKQYRPLATWFLEDKEKA